MNLILIPTVVSVAVLALFFLAAVFGWLLMLGRRSADAGRSLIRRTSVGAVMAIIFAWMGFVVALAIMNLVGDGAAVAILWLSGPIGMIVGFGRASRHGNVSAQEQSEEHAQ